MPCLSIKLGSFVPCVKLSLYHWSVSALEVYIPVQLRQSNFTSAGDGVTNSGSTTAPRPLYVMKTKDGDLKSAEVT